jgi:hypothetical protein
MVTGGATWRLGHSERLFPALALAFWTAPVVYVPSKIVVVLLGDPAKEPPGCAAAAGDPGSGWAAEAGAAGGGGGASGAQAETARIEIPKNKNCFIRSSLSKKVQTIG